MAGLAAAADEARKVRAVARRARAEEEEHAAKRRWMARVAVVEPEALNNHAPGGSFAKPAARMGGGGGHGGGSGDWWCQHFEAPLLQLSGQGDDVRAAVLRRVWEEGACFNGGDDGDGDGDGGGGVPAAYSPAAEEAEGAEGVEVRAGGVVDGQGGGGQAGGFSPGLFTRAPRRAPTCRGLGL